MTGAEIDTHDIVFFVIQILQERRSSPTTSKDHDSFLGWIVVELIGWIEFLLCYCFYDISTQLFIMMLRTRDAARTRDTHGTRRHLPFQGRRIE
jgi:hypothetical protein